MSIIAVISISMMFSDKIAHACYDESRSIWIGGFVRFSCVRYVILQSNLASLVVKHTLPLRVIAIALFVASYIIYEIKVPERYVFYIGVSIAPFYEVGG